MRRSQRLIAVTIVVALSSALAGCGSMGGGFDPSDLLDFLDTKKKLPGERKAVFPEGVPGLEQGVPKDLYKGSRQQQMEDPNAQAAAVAAPPPPDARSKRGAKSKGPSAPAAARTAPGAEPAETAANPDAAPEEEGSTAIAPPPPKPKAIVRKRTTAPPAEPTAVRPTTPAQPTQQSAAPFPAPIPSGTFTR